MKYTKKLGAKQILGDVKKVVAEKCPIDGDQARVYSIYGITHSFKTGVSQYGEWVSFIGHMEATNYHTGEQFEANNCFIPEPLQTMILDALKSHDSVEFSFTVHVKRRDDTKEGYEYIVEPHKKAQENDPLAHLRETVPNRVSVDRKPPAEEKPAPETAAETTQANEGENEPTPEVVEETPAKPKRKTTSKKEAEGVTA